MRLHPLAFGALLAALAVPAAAHAEEDAPPKRRGDLTTIEVGATVFAMGYVPALLVGLEGAGSGSSLWINVIPVVGPYVSGVGLLSAPNGGMMDKLDHGLGALFVMDGIVQTLGAVVFTAGFLIPRSRKEASTGFRVTSLGMAHTTLVVGGTF